MRTISIALMVIGLNTSLNAFWSGCDDIQSEYEITGGYRVDKLEARSEFYKEHSSYTADNSLKISGINIFEIGARVRWVLYDNWLFKASLACGVTNHGLYKQSGIDELGDRGHIDIHVKKGNSRDASACFGYIFEPFSGCEITPIIGVSYDYLRVTMRDNHPESCYSSSPDLDNLTYKNKWNGPLVGLDGRYYYGCFQLDAGYEYHWASWHGNWRVPKRHHRHKAFSDIRQSNDAYGNMGYFTLGWNINACLYAGLEFKCQYFKAKRGDEYNQDTSRSCGCSSSSYSSSSSSSSSSSYNSFFVSSFDSSSSSSSDRHEIGKLKSAHWQDYSITLELRNFF